MAEYNFVQLGLIFGIVILVAAILYFGARYTDRWTRNGLWAALLVGLVVYAILVIVQIGAWPISNLTVLFASLLAAAIIGRTLSTSSALIVFCITAGVVDFLSFSGGLTAKIIADYQQGQNLLLQYLSITAPISVRLTPVIGVGDLIVLGSIYAALLNLGYQDWLGFVLPLGGLLIALALGLMVGGIYALPFIGGATITYLFWKARAGNTSTPGEPNPS